MPSGVPAGNARRAALPVVELRCRITPGTDPVQVRVRWRSLYAQIVRVNGFGLSPPCDASRPEGVPRGTRGGWRIVRRGNRPLSRAPATLRLPLSKPATAGDFGVGIRPFSRAPTRPRLPLSKSATAGDFGVGIRPFSRAAAGPRLRLRQDRRAGRDVRTSLPARASSARRPTLPRSRRNRRRRRR
jgi:hypothetical protein